MLHQLEKENLQRIMAAKKKVKGSQTSAATKVEIEKKERQNDGEKQLTTSGFWSHIKS